MQRYLHLFVCCVLFLCLAGVSWANGLTFNFTLNRSCFTSAGAFKSDGTLIKTLWRHVYFVPGTYTRTWDGTDDNGVLQPTGTYTVKVLSQTMRYYWDGVVGNTSDSFVDANWHTCTVPGILTLAIDGTNAFAAMGGDEGQPSIRRFNTSAPNQLTAQIMRTQWITYPVIATDGTRVYVAGGSSGYHTGFQPTRPTGTWATAYNVSDNTPANFSCGQTVDERQLLDGTTGTWDEIVPSAIDYDQQPGGVTPHYATGLAVQKTGSVLAIAHGDLNSIHCFNKTTGAALPNISVTNPQSIAFAPNGDLWVLTGTTACRYVNVGTDSCTLATTISGLQKPLCIAVHPSNNNVVMIADGGTSQQVKCFNSTGTAQWTFGKAGGYSSVNVVSPNSDTTAELSFVNAQYGWEMTCLAIQPDGSFWINDCGNMRMLHIDRSLSPMYVNQIAWIMGNRITCDPNNPTRLFWGFHEYQIDYSKPLTPGDPNATGGNGCWKLVRNWRYGLPADYLASYIPGFMSVVTLSNGRTYARVNKYGTGDIAELPSNGNPLRFTGTTGIPGMTMMDANGNLRSFDQTNGITVYNQALTGFDGSGNPQWGATTVLATAPSTPNDPCGSPGDAGDFNGKMLPITSSNMIISLKYSCGAPYAAGMHLGGIPVGGTQWKWKASPAISYDWPTDGLGSFPVDAFGSNAAINVWASGQNVLLGYNGQNSGGSNQYKHFWDDGLFVGQFGVAPDQCYIDGAAIPGFNSNIMSMSDLVTVNEAIYFYLDDESQHGGMHRWRMEGQNTIQEATGSGVWNSTITLVNPTVAYPTELTAVPGNGKVYLSWNAATGATSYNVKRSAVRGGSYTTIATGVTATNYTATGLTNGTPYYFMVTAMVNGVESATSNEINSSSSDTTVPVAAIGDAYDAYSVLPSHRITSTAPQNNTPALTDINPIIVGDFPLQVLGKKGYHIFYADGGSNVLAPFSVTVGSGWECAVTANQFIIDGVATNNLGLRTQSTGTIDINVSDNNWHYLTVYTPTMPNTSFTRKCTVTLTPQGQTSPAATYNFSEPYGKNHWLQFRFQGNVTLTVVDNGSTGGTNIQALFFDDVPYSVSAPTFSITPGAYLSAPTVSLSTPTNGATIRYTTDGSTPSSTNGTVYSTPVTINTNTTLKAVAYKSGLIESAITSGVYTIQPLANTGFETPAIGVGNYQYTPLNAGWTFDGGSGVTGNGSAFTGGVPNAPEGSQVGFLQGTGSVFQWLGLSAGTYYLTGQAVQRSGNNQDFQVRIDGVAVGTFTAASGTYQRFTTSAFTVTAGLHNITLIGIDTVGGDNTAFIDDIQLQCAAPTFSPSAGTYSTAQTVTITSATPGTTIRYTTDGSTPSSTNGTIYTGPVTVGLTTTLKSIAYETGLANSTVATAIYTITR